jgi:hypothetical protein
MQRKVEIAAKGKFFLASDLTILVCKATVQIKLSAIP